MRQTLRHDAATIRPILRVFFASLLVLSLFPLASRADNNASSRRDAAKAQFDRAEKARAGARSASRERAHAQGLHRPGHRVSARVPDYFARRGVPASLNQVAELFRTMGDLFDAKYYQRSIDSFQFLLREYPTSKYREDALLAIAHIEQDDLHDPVLAQKTYEQFLALHPRSSHAAEVRAALDKLNAAERAAQNRPQLLPAAKDHPDRIDSQNDLRGKNSADDGHKTRVVRRQFRRG